MTLEGAEFPQHLRTGNLHGDFFTSLSILSEAVSIRQRLLPVRLDCDAFDFRAQGDPQALADASKTDCVNAPGLRRGRK